MLLHNSNHKCCVCVCVCSVSLRRQKNKNTVYIQDDIVQYHTLLDEVNLNFEQKQIQNIIQEMDTTTREVIHLILYEEKSYEEV